MRTWSLTFANPATIRLAADARLTSPSYVDDQIWEVTLGGGDPPALGFQTTYGFRGRGGGPLPPARGGGGGRTAPAPAPRSPCTLHSPTPCASTSAPDPRSRCGRSIGWASRRSPRGGSSSAIMPRIPGGCAWRSTRSSAPAIAQG